MKIMTIVYPTAVQFWLNSSNLWITNRIVPESRNEIVLPQSFLPPNDEEVCRILMEKYGFEAPLTCLAASAETRRRNALQVCAVRTRGQIPKGFVYLETIHTEGEKIHVLVATPEMCFLQAAATLPFLELLKFGYVLCARYLPDTNDPGRQYARNPITNIACMQDFLDQVKGVSGIKTARQTLRYVCGLSNSPMESTGAIVATLPFTMGGFSIKPPVMNYDIALSARGAEVFQRPVCCGDLVWPEEKVAVEYDSNAIHLSKEQHKWDLRKTLALEYSGYQVFRITADTLQNPNQAELFFSHLRSALGMRKQWNRIQQTQNERRQLLAALKDWNSCFR